MLTRLAVEWASTLVGTRLETLRQESGDRFRLTFAAEGFERSLIACLNPRRPWMGESVKRWDGPLWSPDPAVNVATRTLAGRRVERIVKAPYDRTVRIELGEGRALVLELTPQTPNLIVLGERGVVEAVLRPYRGNDDRLTPGHPWSARGVPQAKLDPFSMSPEAIDSVAPPGAGDVVSQASSLQQQFMGLGAVGAALIVSSRLASGHSLGTIVRERLDSVLDGTTEIVIEAADGLADPSMYRLLPWRPDVVPSGRKWLTRDRAGATAGYFFDTRDAAERVAQRIATLGTILRRELGRTRKAEIKVREELRSFEDPDKHKRMGEALLAGLNAARRTGETVLVPDPYDPLGREIAIPARREQTLPEVAEDLFRRQRRARRGLASAGARAESLSKRISRLEGLLVAQSRTTDELGAETLEAAMRGEGLPVGLATPTRAGRAAARTAPPHLDGVRMIKSTDGWTILVGRTGPDNDKLTFKIAAPDDLWLHAAGVPGAHVVIRNPDRHPSAPAATLAEAAGLALWFSEARSSSGADVMYTRRKNVRRARGGTSGKVLIKRFETIRARANPPPDGT